MVSFDEIVFLYEEKICKVYNNLAPTYLQELFQMRDINLESIVSNLRSVSRTNCILPQAKCNLFKSSHSVSYVVMWNRIPVSIKSSPLLESFMNSCTQ